MVASGDKFENTAGVCGCVYFGGILPCVDFVEESMNGRPHWEVAEKTLHVSRRRISCSLTSRLARTYMAASHLFALQEFGGMPPPGPHQGRVGHKSGLEAALL